MVPSLPLLSCELSVSVKENPDRRKNYTWDSKKKIMKEISLSMNEHYQCQHQRFCNVCNFSSNKRNYSLFIKGFMNLILKKIITAVTLTLKLS